MMANTPVTNVVNQTVQQKAAQSAKPNIPATKPTMPLPQQSLATNIKNALFGNGSLSAHNVDLSAVQADIANALKNAPTNANLLAAQKSLATINSPTASAVAKTAAYSAAQKSLNSFMSSSTAPKTTTTTTTPTPNKPATPPKTATTTSTVGIYTRNALFGSGSLSETPNVGAIASDVANALKLSPKDTNLLAAQKALSTIGANTNATDTATALKAAQTALLNVYNASKTPATPTPNKVAPVTPQPTPNIPAPTPTDSDSGATVASTSIPN
jgi:hypothetical protein